jgi:hypothetical protein
VPHRDDPAVEAETTAWAEFYQAFIGANENPAEAMSDLFVPIIDDVDKVTVAGAKDYNPEENRLVGAVGASFYWREIFRNILPSGSDGIDIVVSNPCTLAFSYRINGPRVEYLGAKDKHDPAYNSLREESRLDELGCFAIHGSGYTGPSIDNSACLLTFSLYPSDAMKDQFTSNNVIIFTVCV